VKVSYTLARPRNFHRLAIP